MQPNDVSVCIICAGNAIDHAPIQFVAWDNEDIVALPIDLKVGEYICTECLGEILEEED